MKTIMGIRLYSIDEVARILGKSVYTIRQYIYTQKLGAVQIGREYWIPEKEILLFLKKNANKRDIQL
ncbi:helix-turn-helix domain-containing protein [Desulfurobacterium atlanticum]|uniref:DNA binding domain-containing protein, excisionase family n=1 Tax=Desulfurobacterium atlanticum TaxID=240169 RepID=A0A238ZIC6_9BACT|nr:helix-turn-helix domain-containing protein [Desulfurobacterium atlanticum]SNR83195.1 DNA binding domain-containing protein, excisionase family [Desulfurobacterium atlanticum]